MGIWFYSRYCRMGEGSAVDVRMGEGSTADVRMKKGFYSGYQAGITGFLRLESVEEGLLQLV